MEVGKLEPDTLVNVCGQPYRAVFLALSEQIGLSRGGAFRSLRLVKISYTAETLANGPSAG
jgi:cystathionine beta-lyase family protein involved in aluminum resistance